MLSRLKELKGRAQRAYKKNYTIGERAFRSYLPRQHTKLKYTSQTRELILTCEFGGREQQGQILSEPLPESGADDRSVLYPLQFHRTP